MRGTVNRDTGRWSWEHNDAEGPKECHSTKSTDAFKWVADDPKDSPRPIIDERFEEECGKNITLCEIKDTDESDRPLHPPTTTPLPYFITKLNSCRHFKPKIQRFNPSQHNCWALKVFPGNVKNTVHLKFREDLSQPGCRDLFATEVAFVALDETGMPVGRSGLSFTLFEKNKTRETESEEDDCSGEDLDIDGDRDLGIESRNYQCFYDLKLAKLYRQIEVKY
jgi:hypothetical protein